jgi:hypothetical protein
MFVKFAAKELGLTKLPTIHYVGSAENKKAAFGHSMGNDIWIRITDRHPIDVMRTITHELIHFRQKGGSERFKEDQANAIAGRVMRKFDTTFPSAFKLKPIREDVASTVPANSAGAGGVEGIGVGPRGEPGGRTKKKKIVDIIGPISRLQTIGKK